MTFPCVAIRTNMFQGSFQVTGTDVDNVTKRLQDPETRNPRNAGTGKLLLDGLHVRSVKFAKKGRLGSVLYTWTEGSVMDVNWTVTEECGSIQISCTTVPHDHKVSIFFFGSGKVKICGALMDPYTATLKKYPETPEDDLPQSYDLMNVSIQAYMDEVKSLVCDVIGGVPDEPVFSPGIMNGQFALGMHISNVNRLSLFAASRMKDTFSFVRGQEPEINGRKFAVQLFLNNKLHMSFDHLGKVQIFCAKSFSDMVSCWKAFVEVITRAMDENIVELSDLPEKKNHKAFFRLKKKKNQFIHFCNSE